METQKKPAARVAQKPSRTIETLERLISLLFVLLLLAGTAVAGGKIFGHSLKGDAAAANNAAAASIAAAPAAQTLEAMGLSDARLTAVDSSGWSVQSASGEDLGLLLNSESFASDVRGYAGPVPLLVYIDAEGTVKSIAAQPNDETEGYFAQAERLLSTWNGLRVDEAAQTVPDAVSGATFSSRGIIETAQKTFAAYGQIKNIGVGGSGSAFASPTIGWPKALAAIAVLILGIFAAFYKGTRKKTLRTIVLILNVLILGFWTGQFISFTLLHGWLQNGIDWFGALPMVLIVAAAVLLPYFGRKNHYCTWTCPYGSLQELAYRVPVPKIKVQAKTFKWLRTVRLCVLYALLLYLWVGCSAAILDYEPFAAFMFESASTAVLILAGAFVVLSMFFPHPWCQAVCPVGMTLNLAEDAKGTYRPTVLYDSTKK